MTNVVSICGPKLWTLEEAQEMVSMVKRITEKAELEVEQSLKHQRYLHMSHASEDTITKETEKMQSVLNQWGTKMTKLGMKAYGQGYVGFDSGWGYWSYHYKETIIEYYHGHDESPLYRKKVSLLETGAF